jgi:hypothetical protein
MNEPLPALPSLAAPRPTRSARGPGLDYDGMRAEGLSLLRRWAGALWTDFGEHDPGVTLIELFCFGLTELGYRAGFPIEDLLAPLPRGGDPPLLAGGRGLRRCEPVTQADFRRLIIDRLPEVADAWLEPVAPGLYALSLYRAPCLPGLAERFDAGDERRLVHAARRLFHRHRPLGEDLDQVDLLRPVAITIRGSAMIEAGARAEAVMAEILYRLGALLAPEPRRRSLEGMSRAEAAAQLQGPRLANGLIADAELGRRRTELAENDIERHVSAVPGVLSVGGLDIRPPLRPLAADECFALDARLDGDAIPFALLRDGERVEVDVDEVRRRLERRWSAHRRIYRTRAEVGRLFAVPSGRVRDTASHVPLASHLPAVYGVGERALDAHRPPRRRAQARQLLGYLAVFERVFVDHLDRLSCVPDILAGAELEPESTARSLGQVIPALAPLLIDGGPDADGLFGRAPFSADQQERLLDFLLALHGEEPLVVPASGSIAVKRALLAGIASLAARRGRGFDLLGRGRRRNASGLEARAEILLGGGGHHGRGRPRVLVIEHVLLRARDVADPGAAPVDPFRITAIVHPGERGASAAWRRRAVAMLRAEAPAHLTVRTLFVDRARWVRAKRLHKLWRKTLRDSIGRAADLLSDYLVGFMTACETGESDG